MSYRFGEATPEQWEAAQRVWSEVYRGGQPVSEFQPPGEGESWFVAELGGEVVWAAEVFQAASVRTPFGPVLKCGQVAGVATLPHARGQGVAGRAMKDLNRAMRAQGCVAAALYPYRESFYAGSGYARCGWRWQVKVPRERMPDLRPELRIEQVAPQDVMRLDACYSAMAGGLSGACIRGAEEWEHRLGKKPEAIYAAVGPDGVEGYFWARPTEFWEWVTVGEFAWSSDRGYRSCLAALRGLCENMAGAIWCEPPSSPFLDRYRNQGCSFAVHRPTMFRVLDVEGALRALPGSGDPYQLEVLDPDITENRGPILVTPAAQTLTAACGVASFQMGIEEFSQVLMGAPSASALIARGELPDCQATIDMAQHLPAAQVCCMDFF